MKEDTVTPTCFTFENAIRRLSWELDADISIEDFLNRAGNSGVILYFSIIFDGAFFNKETYPEKIFDENDI